MARWRQHRGAQRQFPEYEEHADRLSGRRFGRRRSDASARTPVGGADAHSDSGEKHPVARSDGRYREEACWSRLVSKPRRWRLAFGRRPGNSSIEGRRSSSSRSIVHPTLSTPGRKRSSPPEAAASAAYRYPAARQEPRALDGSQRISPQKGPTPCVSPKHRHASAGHLPHRLGTGPTSRIGRPLARSWRSSPSQPASSSC